MLLSSLLWVLAPLDLLSLSELVLVPEVLALLELLLPESLSVLALPSSLFWAQSRSLPAPLSLGAWLTALSPELLSLDWLEPVELPLLPVLLELAPLEPVSLDLGLLPEVPPVLLEPALLELVSLDLAALESVVLEPALLEPVLAEALSLGLDSSTGSAWTVFDGFCWSY